MNDEEYELMKGAVRRTLNINLDYYKQAQMQRRLASFVDRNGGGSISDFCDRLPGDKDMQARLHEFLTINVTEFFRDTNQFQMLKDKVLPEILKKTAMPRIWSAGSSRGNEAYSVAIYLHQTNPGLRFSITGTDIDEKSIAISRAGGPYPDNELKNADASVRKRYFEQRSDGWYVRPVFDRKIQFKHLDLLRDDFESSYDLIICRNVVIYFSDQAKAELNTKFGEALKPDGVLFVGGTETILNPEAYGLSRFAPSYYRKSTVAIELKAA